MSEESGHQQPQQMVAHAIKDAGYRFANFNGQLYMGVGGTYVPAMKPIKKLLIQYFGTEWKSNLGTSGSALGTLN